MTLLATMEQTHILGPSAKLSSLHTVTGTTTASTRGAPLATKGTSAPSTTKLYVKVQQHFELVHRLFDESAKVHSSPAALHETISAKMPGRNGTFGEVSGLLQRLYPRTYKYTQGFAKFQAQHQEVINPGARVKFLVVTIAMAHQQGFREVHRRTWMGRPGLCKVNESTPEEPKGCRAFATFVVGKVGNSGILDAQVDAEARLYGDVNRVEAHDPDIQDPNGTGFSPPNKGLRHKEKDIAVLLYVARHWPWVTHVGKSDLDNYPAVDLILRDISDPEGMKLGFSKGVPPPRWNPTRPIFYGALMGGSPEDIVQRARGSFMQGQFYAISRSLLACIMERLPSAPEDYLYPHRKKSPPLCSYEGEGDMAFGCIVRYFTVDKGGCSTPWWINVRDIRPGRWHMCKP